VRKSTKKLLVIVGPTAAGKSKFAVSLAKKLDGEVVSADSRQVYKGLSIGSGMITKKEMKGIPHHLLSIVSPKRTFSVTQYQQKARKVISDIQNKDKLPILVGGSPLYIYAVIDGWIIPKVKPNTKLRKELEKHTLEQLFLKLKKLDPKRAQTIEQKNKRRLIRALEIVLSTGKTVPSLKRDPLPYPVLLLGIQYTEQKLKRDIKERFLRMLKEGFLKEVKELYARGISPRKVKSFGFEYREAVLHLEGKLSRDEMITQVVGETWDFARRQMTWFKKDQRIHWITTSSKAKNITQLFLKKTAL
jgi:tRNA dimethylallyltransferase